MSATCNAAAAGQRLRTIVVLVALAGSAAFADLRSARAQTAEPQAWRVQCAGDGKSLDCRAVQQALARETRQPLASVAVRPLADGKTASMVAQLPLGLDLTEPAAIGVDNGPTERQAIQTCTAMGCFFAFALNDSLLAGMRTGGALKITVQDVNKKPVELSLPLLGFGLAFDKAR